MVIYQVTVWTKPVDWAESSRKESVGFFKSKSGAEARVDELKKSKDWNVYYGDAQIWTVPLHD